MNTPEPDDSLPNRIRETKRRSLPSDFKQALIEELYSDASDPTETVVTGPWWMPPRWLGFGIAACWFAILTLQLTTPKDDGPLFSQSEKISPEHLDYVSHQELLVALDIEIN